VNKLLQNYKKEIKLIMAKYPEGRERSAVMPLIYLAQRNDSYVTKGDLADIADLTGMSTTQVASIIGFYTLFYDAQEGKYRIQVCNDLPCALRGADEFLDELCKNVGVKVGETSKDGLITIEGVMCIAGCDNAPLFQLQGPMGIAYHENQTLETTLELIKELREMEAKDE
jgi:NADH-quinone oxidoreductase subunit E